MRTLILISIFASTAFSSKCISIKDDLDREYCFKKEVRSIIRVNENLWNKYKHGISPTQKQATLDDLNFKIKVAQEMADTSIMKKNSFKKLKERVTSAKSVTKKKKKRNKLKEKLKKLGIKL